MGWLVDCARFDAGDFAFLSTNQGNRISIQPTHKTINHHAWHKGEYPNTC